MIPYRQLLRVFGRIGMLSFGGPAAQIALMHRELVEKRDWLTEEVFLRALSLCMLLPGPEAMQLATYAGWRLRGTLGGFLAGALFVLPGAAIIFALALAYAAYGQLPLVQAAFLGIKAAVIIVVIGALCKLSGKALPNRGARVLAALSFTAIFVIGLPFPLVVLAAGLWGYLSTSAPSEASHPPTTRATPLRVIGLWGALWAAPLVWLFIADQDFLLELGLFFSKLAVVTFGGAYAVLGYMTQTVAFDLGWLSTDQMIDALGLAETTPGPLILVTQFVAMLAGHAQSGVPGALAAGIVALWVTFTPCFLWIFLAGPYLDRLSAMPRLSAALSAITAAIVGVIASLSLWFALHVLFGTTTTAAPLALPVPALTTFDPSAFVFCLIAAVLMFWRGWGFGWTMALLAALALGLELLRTPPFL